MTKAGRFALLLLLAWSGVACHAKSDLLKGRDGGAGASGSGGGGTAGAGGGAGSGGATGGSGGAAAGAGGGGTGGAPDPIVGMPLGTFDTDLDGFFLNTSTGNSSGVVNGNDGSQTNVYGFAGLPLPVLSHDPTAGNPTPGSLKLTATFTISCCQFVEVRSDVAGIQDWSDRILHARVRVVSGNFAGIAQLFVMTSSGHYGWSTARVPLDGNWHELTLDVPHAPRPGPGSDWDGTGIVEFGVQFHTGLNIGQMTNGPVVFQLDSFSLEQVVAPPDGGTPDVPPDGGTPDVPAADAAPDVPAADGPQVAKDQFLTAYTNARCVYQARCGLFTSLDACLASTFPSQFRYMFAAVDRGVATYDPGAAAACVAAIAAQACAGTTPISESPCARIFVGTIPISGACIESGECAPAGAEPPVCVPTASSCACCAGTCAKVEVAAPGGSCTGAVGVLRRCPAGHYCQTSTRTCLPVAGLGQACDWQGSQPTCEPGMFCSYDQTVSGYRCFQRAATGGSCAVMDMTGAPSCASLSDYCAATTTKTCAPRVPVGGSCVGAAPGGICVRTAYCDGSVCRAQKAPGEVCGTIAQGIEKECVGDLVCFQAGDAGAPTCTPPSSGDICPPPA